MDIKLESFSGFITGVAPIVASVMAIVYGMFKCRSEHYQAEKLKVETKKGRAELRRFTFGLRVRDEPTRPGGTGILPVRQRLEAGATRSSCPRAKRWKR